MGAPSAQPGPLDSIASGRGTPPPTVSLSPDPAGWPALIRKHRAQTATDAARQQFRRELGLPADRPVIMSGHQAQWWHAGILSKQIALAAACRSIVGGAGSAWVVVDQDASDSLTISYPRAGSPGELPTRGTWAIAPDALAAQLRADAALHDLPAFAPSAPPTDAATPDIARGLRAIADSAARWSSAPNAAEQIARANAELLGSALEPAPPLVFATALLRTTAGRALLEKMAEDPHRCVAAYNDAVKEEGAGVIAPLSLVPDKGRFELPLWQLSAGEKISPRRRVFAASLGDTPLDALAPRGVMMTLLIRWMGCDLFIHGLGGGASGEGGGYDKVTERWAKLWLGVDLAPSVVATATAYLPMGIAGVMTEHDLYAAHRRVEQARHAPGTLGDTGTQAQKNSLVAAIASSKDRSERHRLFRSLQDLLGRYRDANADRIAAVRGDVQATTAEIKRNAILRERTWPWPLLPRPLLLELRRTVAAQAGA